MKTKYVLPIGLMFATLSAGAQDIYKMEMFSSSDLNGTARYVGMGGAMNALGADISTIGTNPAAMGMYRRSDISMTGSILVQPNAQTFFDIDKARCSFDQMGFIYAAKMSGDLKFVNFGFNYHKEKNFKNFADVSNFKTHGLSQSLQMLDLAYTDHWLDLEFDHDRGMTTPLTCLGYDTQMIYPLLNDKNEVTGYIPSEAESYNYRRVQWGGIQAYDFNLSLNWNDQLYGGLTFGVKNVDMHSGTFYEEQLRGDGGELHPYFMSNEEAISGTGYDVKLGFILRPIETSPFRIGFAVHTPTFYDLSTDAYLYMESPYRSGNQDYTSADVRIGNNEYKIRTPWKINVSAATTVMDLLALDAEYEFSNYGSCKVSYFDDYYNYDYYSNSHDDRYLNDEADRYLKSVHSFRFGAEARLSRHLYARAGYNYVSAPMEKDAFLNLFTNSSSYYYSTNTDYVNLGETQRATCGLGFKSKHLYADVAYQYQKQSGDLYTFHVPEDNSTANRLQAAQIDFIRHNVMLTIGYKF